MRLGKTIILLGFTLLLTARCWAQPLAWRYYAVGSVTSISISGDGRYVLVGNKDGVIYLLDREKGVELWKYSTWEGVNAVSISEDGAYSAAGGNNRIVYLFDRGLSGRSYLWRYPLGAAVLDIALSGDGKYLVAGSFDHRVYLFHVGKPAPLWSYLTGGDVRSVDISYDGNFLVAGSDDGYLYIFDKDYTGYTFISRFKTEGPIRSVAISRDGYSVAAGSSDGYLYFQDRRKGGEVYTWRHKLESKVTSVSITSDGGFIAAGDSSGRIYLFDKGHSNNTYLWSYPVGVKSALVSISADGELIASGSDEGVYLFDKGFEKNSFLWYLPLDLAVTDLEISTDGSSLIAGDYKGYLYMFWPLTRTTDRKSSEALPLTLEKPSIRSDAGEVRPIWKASYFPPLIMVVIVVIIGFTYLRARWKKPALKGGSRHLFGYRPLDLLLRDGIPEGYSIALSSMPCDQKDDVIEGFLKAGLDEDSTTVYISNTLDKVAGLAGNPKMHILICNPQADEIVPSMGNVEKVKSLESLTDVNIGIMRLLERLHGELSQKGEIGLLRVCLDNLDDVLIQHKGSTTRKWLLELIPRLKKMNGIVLATVNPRMHSEGDLNAVLSVFDGEIDILEGTKRGRLYRKILVSRMYNVHYSRRGLEI